jgi:hypothetical protein
MQRWFLSYHSADQTVAERLKAGIEAKDSGSHVFFAPTGLRMGGSWTSQLAQEIAQANAFILLIGEHVGPWQVLEYDEALDKWANAPAAFPLVVVLLQGASAPGLPFLRRLHWLITPDPASEKDVARLFEAVSGGGTSPGELWRYTSPYRGLEAMEEKDSDFFFGRERETVDILSVLAGAPDRLPVLVGNSGVGKSSLAQSGVLASLKRQAWPEVTLAPGAWPAAFQDSRKWCFLSLKPGTDPLKALVETFLDTWQFVATDFERIKQQNGFVDLLRDGKASLPDLIDATERRRKELHQPKPPGFLLYIDQGEELHVRAEETRRRRFSELIAQALPDPRLRIMMSMRSDFLGHLQNNEPLFKARELIEVPPLREDRLRDIVGRPAELLSARFEDNSLIEIISQRTAEDSVKDVGALPLLSYTLDDMWAQMVRRGDGTLRLPARSFELGGVLVNRANKFLETHPGAQDVLRRVLTLRLATVRDDGEPTRRRAARSEFSEPEWRLVSELADYPYRLLVTATAEGGETYAEVAHEAIFRRWYKLRDWITAERDFLKWRTVLEAARRAWQTTPDSSKNDALLMGLALALAQGWNVKRAEDVPKADREFIGASEKAENARLLAQRKQLEEMAAAQDERANALRAAEEALNRTIRLKRRQAWVAAMIIALLGMIGWWAYGVISEQRAIAREAGREDIRGQIVAYGAAFGSEETDVVEGFSTSPYTTPLVQTLRQQKNLVEAIVDAHQQVLDGSKGKQRPMLSTSMNGQIYLHRQPTTRRKRVLAISADDPGAEFNKLQGPPHDVEAITAALIETGFSQSDVVVLHNPDRRQIEKAITDIAQAFALAVVTPTPVIRVGLYLSEREKILSPENTLFLFFFSGHGVTVDGREYIIAKLPLDHLIGPTDLEHFAISVNWLETTLELSAAASVIMLDTHFPRARFVRDTR